MNKIIVEEENLIDNEENTVIKGLVSIVVPMLNAEIHLKRCIEALKNQTYKNIEILIIDNASTDSSVDIAKDYAKNDNRIKVFTKKKMHHVAHSRNLGIKKAKGEYISFIDSDDYPEPNFIEVMIKEMEKNNVNIVQCCYTTFDDFGNIRDYLPYQETRIYSGRELCKFMFDFVGLCGPNVLLWNKIYRRKILENVRFFEGTAYEDMFKTHEILYPEDRVLWIKDRLMHWNVNYGSATSKYNYRDFYFDEIKAYIERVRYFKERNDDELLRLCIKRLYYISTQHYYLYPKFIDDKVKVRKTLAIIKSIIKELYPKIKKSDFPKSTKRRADLIRFWPWLFGYLSINFKLDFRK